MFLKAYFYTMRYGVLTFLLIGCCFSTGLNGQVGMLSKGNWVKISVPTEGVYQLSGAQLKGLGLGTKINANQVQLFGMDLAKLTEKVPMGLPDSLTELAIEMQDGGDGIFDEQDRLLFYAQGKNKWMFNNATEGVIRNKIVSNDSLYFFVTVGQVGKRLRSYPNLNTASKFVKTYPAKWLIEKDSINILNSGKVFLGDPMGTGVGKKSTLVFPINMDGVEASSPVLLQTQLAATSYQANANFSIKLNDKLYQTIALNPVSGFLFDDAYKIRFDSSSFWIDNPKAASNVQVDFNASSTATGWIDYLALQGQRKIGFWGNSSFGFDYVSTNSNDQIVEFEIQNASNQTRVWDVTQCLEPKEMSTQLVQNTLLTFKTKDSTQKYFYAFESNKIAAAEITTFVNNDPHFSVHPVDYIIISAPDYLPAAMRLKTFHEKQNGLKVSLIKSTQLFNEMSSGQASPIAIRNYIKYILEQSKIKNQPKPIYLLLFGMGNFNPSKIQLNKELPVYTSDLSNAILTSYSTDDFYAIQQAGDQINNPQSIDSMDIAIGRIPARTIAEASMMVDKLIQYQSNKKMGIWQNQLTWVADDADYNLHLQDAEEIVNNLKSKTANWNHKKLYLDLFKSTQTPTGAVYPEVNKGIQESVQAGTLVLNYTGHGNYLRLSEEAVISKSEMQLWNNAGKLPVMVTASCDFAPYDQPSLSPIGFDALMQNEKGIVALVAANRLVFAYSNKQINDAFMQALLVPNSAGAYPGIGVALQIAKKYNFSKNGDRLNAFKFGLMGDPAMRIAQPKFDIECSLLNDAPLSDSIYFKIGEKYKLNGYVKNQGQVLSSFNGFIDLVLWDAPSSRKTLANQSTSQSVVIETQEQALFRGKATVKDGRFEIRFLMPTAMPSSKMASLKLQLYAYNDSVDASKQLQSIFIQSASKINLSDTIGPEINAKVNSIYFKSGDWVSSPSTLLVTLKDSSGIQSSGNELGHDLKLIIDDTIPVSYILNPFFAYNLNDYQSGIIQYPLPVMTEGKHRLIIKAADLLGNISRDTILVDVPGIKNSKIRNLSIMPNPVINQSKFSFEIKNSLDPLLYQIEVLDVNGMIHYSTKALIQPMSNRIIIDWDGRNNQGGILPTGMYYYRVQIQQNDLSEQLINTLLKF